MSLLPYSLARAVLFNMDPEAAHELTLDKLEKLQHSPLMCLAAQPKVSDPIRLVGLDFFPTGSAWRRPGQERAASTPGAHGLRLRRVGTVTPGPARQSQAAHVPHPREERADQPPRLQQRRARRLHRQRPQVQAAPEPQVRRHAAGPEHRQERRHADRTRDRRLSGLPGRCLSARRLRDGQHLEPQHEEPARAAERRGARPAAGRSGGQARQAGGPAGRVQAGVRQDSARPRRGAGGRDRRHAQSATAWTAWSRPTPR